MAGTGPLLFNARSHIPRDGHRAECRASAISLDKGKGHFDQ
jgi:hypothetical protein